MMSRLLNNINLWFEKVPDWVRCHKKWVWSLFIISTLIVGAGAGQFKIDESLDAYFREDDPMKVNMNRFRALFGSDEVVYLIYKAKDGDVFSENSLRAVKGIQDDLLNYRLKLKTGEKSPLDHITDVRTLINVSYMESREDALVSRNFIGEQVPTTEEEREKVRQIALNHPDYKLLYLSNNSEYGSIIVRTDFGATLKQKNTSDDLKEGIVSEDFESSDFEEEEFDVSSEDVEIAVVSRTEGLPEFEPVQMSDYADFMHVFDEILNQAQYSEHLEYHPVGNPPIMTFFADVILQEMGMISIASLFLIMICLYLLFRSLSAILWPVVIIITTLVWVIGLIGWSGVTMTFIVNIIVFLMLAVGVADTVHILSGYLFFRNQGEDHEQALRSVFKKTGLACFMTSITTAIGMLSLLFVPIVPIKMFGLFASIGVFLAFIFTVFMLPAMLDLWGPFSQKRSQKIKEQGAKSHFIQMILRKFEPISYKYPIPVILVFLTASIVLLIGIKDVKVDTNMVNIIKEGQAIRNTYDIVDQFMAGTGIMEILVNTEVEDGLKDPRVLKAMEDLQDFIIREYPDLVTKSSSLVNVVKDSFKAINEGQEGKYIIPENAGVLANTLFMFNNVNPIDRRRLVTDDYSIGRITVNLHNEGSVVYSKMIKSVEAYANQSFAPLKNDYPNIAVNITGSLALIMQLTEYISWSQIQSFGLALVVISLLLLFVFASMRIGFISILPNIFPILSIFGLMGYLGIALDTDTLLVAPITIGIAVDDTVHFLTHYRIEIAKHGRIKEAIISTYRETGQAIAFTSIILTIGFLVFLFSTHQGLSNFGIMSAVAFFSALLADLFLLPSMCLVFKATFKTVEQATAPTKTAVA